MLDWAKDAESNASAAAELSLTVVNGTKQEVTSNNSINDCTNSIHSTARDGDDVQTCLKVSLDDE